ncbi:MAG: hypothetical protein WCJ04_06110 [Actinomycetes bacterium]
MRKLWLNRGLLAFGIAASSLILATPFAGAAGAVTARGVVQFQNSPAGNISIVQTPSGPTAPCSAFPLVARNSSSSDSATFRLRITLLAPLCAPFTASAVIYAMPGNGAAWPQQLQEKVSFTLQAAGVTEVTFTKVGTPVQFDVVTGATPQQIAPWLQWHGPLLFPFDTATSQQSGIYGPPPVVPEVPLPLLLPLSAVLAAAGGYWLQSSRKRSYVLRSANAPSVNSFG